MSKSAGQPAVAVIGLGLMGGSLARALTRAGYRVIGVDRPAVLRRALAARAVAQAIPRVEQAARLASLVVLAAPPRANLRILRMLARTGPSDLIVTDMGSVKVPICREARRLGLDGFVGGHPMAGSERSGFGASSPDLFRSHSWILTPAKGSARALRAVQRLVRAVGARAHVMDAIEHDRAVAFLSHVPQLVSWALGQAAGADAIARGHLDLAGPGFRDMTRLARSPRPLWREILAQNRPEITKALRAFARALRRPV